MAFTLQELSDREEIRDLLNNWALAVDVRDFDLFESCYTDDAKIEFKEIGYQGSTGRGHREFLEKSAPLFGPMHHVLSNTIFRELTPTKARTSTMVSAATVTLEDVVFFTGAWYHDEMRKTPQGWRIAHRRAERIYLHNFPGMFVPEDAPGNKL